MADFCRWTPRGPRLLGPNWIGPYGHPKLQQSNDAVWDGQDFGGRSVLAGVPEVPLRTDVDLGQMLSEILVPGVAYYNLGNDAATQGRYLASFGWNTAGHLEVIGTLATAGIGGVVAETARGIVGVARAAARGATQLTGQLHHGISRTVHRALEAHPNLRGVYGTRDPRFVTRAVDKAAHNDWDTFHRNLDAEVAGWIRSNPNATQAQFESYLRGVYQRPDVLAHFPNGL